MRKLKEKYFFFLRNTMSYPSTMFLFGFVGFLSVVFYGLTLPTLGVCLGSVVLGALSAQAFADDD